MSTIEADSHYGSSRPGSAGSSVGFRFAVLLDQLLSDRAELDFLVGLMALRPVAPCRWPDGSTSADGVDDEAGGAAARRPVTVTKIIRYGG